MISICLYVEKERDLGHEMQRLMDRWRGSVHWGGGIIELELDTNLEFVAPESFLRILREARAFIETHFTNDLIPEQFMEPISISRYNWSNLHKQKLLNGADQFINVVCACNS